MLFNEYAFPSTDVSDQDLVANLEKAGEFKPLPFHLGGDVALKAPQQLARHMGTKTKKFILSFDKGMGKTLTYLLIAEENHDGPIIILCTKNAMSAQRKAFRKHLAHRLQDFVFVLGTRNQRHKLWRTQHKYHICTYATFLADMGVRAKSGSRIVPSWAESSMVICDEYHKVLRNRKNNATFDTLKKLNPPRLILSSGSVANKGPHSMWAALHLCEPTLFSSYWKYVNTFCIVEETAFGKQITGAKNIPAWRRTISPYIIHRKKDCKDYPAKTRQALEVEMEPWQKKIHDSLFNQLMAEIEATDGSTNFILAMNKLSAAIKVRQLLCCPKFLDPNLGYGAGIEAITNDAQESELTHFVITTQFRGPIPLLQEYLASHDIYSESLVGGMGPDEIDKAIERWTKHGGAIIQTVDFAESYELPAARIMYMLATSYDAERNSQAEDRIHRDIRVTPHPVDIYYVKHMNSLEERIFEKMSIEADIVHDTMNRPLRELYDFLQAKD